MAPRGWAITGTVGLLLLGWSALLPAPTGDLISGPPLVQQTTTDVQGSRQQVQHRAPLPASGDQLHQDLVRLRQDRHQLRIDIRSGADPRTIQADKDAIQETLKKVRQDLKAIRQQQASLRAERVGVRSDARERQPDHPEFRIER